MTFLVVLTRAEKIDKRKMAKPNSVAVMNLRDIYNRYLQDDKYFGILICGGNDPYPVSMERIEKILKIEGEK